MVNTKGGSLSIPNTGVKLEIPPGALTGETLVTMRIVLHQLPKEKKLCFESNSSVVVELLPNKLELLKAAELTLPHCLVLKKGVHWTAKVYSSHHEEGLKPVWEEELMADCKLNERNAVISLSHFSWEKIEIDGKIVEAKRIVVFAAQRLENTRNTYVDVGYHLNLPGAQEVVMSNNRILLADQECKFWKDGELPLEIEFERTKPAIWNYDSSDEKNKEISFNQIEESDRGYRTFVFKRKDVTIVEDCTCYFKAGQKYLMELIFPLQECNTAESGTASSSSAVPRNSSQTQKKHQKRKRKRRAKYSEYHTSAESGTGSSSLAVPRTSSQTQKKCQKLKRKRRAKYKEYHTSAESGTGSSSSAVPRTSSHTQKKHQKRKRKRRAKYKEYHTSAESGTASSSSAVPRTSSQTQKKRQKRKRKRRAKYKDCETMVSATTSKRPSEGEVSQSKKFKGNGSAGYSPGDGSENAGGASTASSSVESQKAETLPQQKAGDISHSSNVPKLDEQVDDKTLEELCTEISNKWKDVGRKLGFKESELNNIEADNKNNRKEAILTMLKSWKQKHGKDATFRILGKALGDAGRKDLQDKLYQRISV